MSCRDKRPHVSTASTGTTAEKQRNSIFRERQRVDLPSTVDSGLPIIEYPRVVLSFKVKPHIYGKYMKLPRSLKRLVRDILEETISNIGKAQIRKDEKHIIVNVPVNISMQKMEVKNIAMDPEVLYEKIRILEAENRELKDIVKYYKKQVQELQDQNTMLLKVKKKYDELKQKIQYWLTWLRKGYIQYVIKEIEAVVKHRG